MLDDLKYIHTKDSADALGVAGKQATQLLAELERAGHANFGPIDNVVYAGMGGSALAALLLRAWPGLKVPFELVRDYDLPPYVGAKTLFIASSHSGNTEETLSALAAAEAAGAQIVVIASGGKLAQIAADKGYLMLKVPTGNQPRYDVLYNFRAALEILDQAGLAAKNEWLPELERAAEFLAKSSGDWAPTVPTEQNQAKRLAQELMGKSIVVYGGPKMFAAAYKWKINFNENAKQVAWVNQLPEFNHNEFIGWTEQPVDKPYAVIDLRSHLENERVQKRFELSERLLSGKRPAPQVVEAAGETLLEQLLWTINLGDFTSLYLALLNGIDPTPIDLVEKFKHEMAA